MISIGGVMTFVYGWRNGRSLPLAAKLKVSLKLIQTKKYNKYAYAAIKKCGKVRRKYPRKFGNFPRRFANSLRVSHGFPN